MATSYNAAKPSGLPTADPTCSFWHTEPSPLLQGHRSTRHLPQQADIVIVGSGITGTSVAYHLLDPDHFVGEQNIKPNVVMLEAREACSGATGRNGGHCQPLLFEHTQDPSIGRFEYKNFCNIEELVERYNIDCEFMRQPGVRAIYDTTMLASAQQALENMRATSPDLAHLVQILTTKEDLAEHRLPNALGAMHTTVAASLWPYKFVAGILERLITTPTALYGTFNLQTLTPVTKITSMTDDKWLVETERGSILAGSVFLATNGYLTNLLPGFTDLIVPCRGQMSALSPSQSISGVDRLRTSLGFEGRCMDDYLIQRPTATPEQLMFGGGRHLAPSLGIWNDSTVNDEVAHYLRTKLPERLQLRDAYCGELDATYQWTGIMGWSCDGLPWVGKLPGFKNLYMSAGYTGHGMPNAWLCGRALACFWDLQDEPDEVAAFNVQNATGLPSAYCITLQRILAAQADVRRKMG